MAALCPPGQQEFDGACGCARDFYLSLASNDTAEALHRACPQPNHHLFAGALESFMPWVGSCCNATSADVADLSLTEACPSMSQRECLSAACSARFVANLSHSVMAETNQCTLCPRGAICDEPMQKVQTLRIAPGYWRANALSEDVMECSGGERHCHGSSSEQPGDSICGPNLYGPFCKTCYPNHFWSTNDTCVECTGAFSVVGEGSASEWLPLVIFISLLLSCCLITACRAHAKRGDAAHKATRTEGSAPAILGRDATVPGTSVALHQLHRSAVFEQLTSTLVIWTAVFASAWRGYLPETIVTMLRQLGNVFMLRLPLDCFVLEYNARFHLYWVVLVVAGIFLGMVAISYCPCFTRGRAAQLRCSAVVFLFVIYPLVSSVVFHFYDCADFEDGARFLRQDYQIDCDSPTHQQDMVYATAAVIVYPIGVPTLFAVIIRCFLRESTAPAVVKQRSTSMRGLLGRLFGGASSKSRLALEAGPSPGRDSAGAMSASLLASPYKRHFRYWDCFNCLWKSSLVGCSIFFGPGSLMQLWIIGAILGITLLLLALLRPYASRTDNLFSILCVATLLLGTAQVLYVSAMEGDESQDVSEVMMTLVAAALILLPTMVAVAIWVRRYVARSRTESQPATAKVRVRL